MSESFEESELNEGVVVVCPYCGSVVETTVDPTGGGVQEYVEDCEVCCRPWSVTVRVGPDGDASVDVSTLDDG